MHVVSRCADTMMVDTIMIYEPPFRSVLGQGKVPSPTTTLLEHPSRSS
jgi:hypothetical protein